MGTVVRPHAHSDGAAARPDFVNENETILYNLVNGNIDFDNLKAALVNAANGLVKLDANALVPLAQIPVLTADKLPTVIPSGIIVMWSGTLGTIPSGWSLCDGTGGTPDLRDKFIYGWSNGVDPGGTGGATTHTHTYSNLPSHTHTAGSDGHPFMGYIGTPCSDGEIGPSNHGCQGVRCSKRLEFNVGVTVSTVGVANPVTNAGSTLPPYFKLAFIIKD